MGIFFPDPTKYQPKMSPQEKRFPCVFPNYAKNSYEVRVKYNYKTYSLGYYSPKDGLDAEDVYTLVVKEWYELRKSMDRYFKTNPFNRNLVDQNILEFRTWIKTEALKRGR